MTMRLRSGDIPQIWNNPGNARRHLNRLDEAEASYRVALRLRPEYREWRGALGQALLLAGQFKERWKEFGSRWLTERLVGLCPLLGVPS
jgi:tetratricopeptide (TPR) repeat protein